MGSLTMPTLCFNMAILDLDEEAMAELFVQDVADEAPEARAERLTAARALVKRDRRRIIGIVAKGAKLKTVSGGA